MTLHMVSVRNISLAWRLHQCDVQKIVLRLKRVHQMILSERELTHLVCWQSADLQVKFYGDRPRGTPPSGELNTRGVAEYIDF